MVWPPIWPPSVKRKWLNSNSFFNSALSGTGQPARQKSLRCEAEDRMYIGVLPSIGGLCHCVQDGGAEEVVFVGTDVPTERN